MNTKKVLLGSLVLAGVVSSCTDEQIMESVQGNGALSERTQVNLTLETPDVESRMTAGTSGWGSSFETHDILGAVLVDGGYAASGEKVWNNVDWTVVDGHVGNNKWSFNPKANNNKGAFETDGTTSVGAWLFYTQYNSKMTTTRNGVEFDFPQIQEGAADLAWVMNNNANFMISPIVNLDGYEGQTMSFTVRTPSVFTSLRMPFDLSATKATKVQKIVVRAKSDASTDVKFPTQYKVYNKNVEPAKMSTAAGAPNYIACPTYSNLTVAEELDKEMNRAYDAMIYAHIDTDSEWNNPGFKATVVDRSNGETTVDYLVVDLDGEHTDKAGNGGLAVAADGKFSAVMLMPAGVYHSITFDIYTDTGVWTVTVDERDEFYNNLSATDKAKFTDQTPNIIFLRPGRNVMLSDIANKFGNKVADKVIVAEEYIKVTEKSTNAQYITKTADLINLINGITKGGDCDVNVISQAAIGGGANDDETIPEHSVIVNQAVMDAVVAKEAQEGIGDIQLVFKGATIKVKGNDAANNKLNIHDMTFNNGAELISGNVKATESVNIPAGKKMLVKSGVNLDLALGQKPGDVFSSLEVESGAIVAATTSATVGNLLNKGTFSIAADKTIASATVENKGTATVEGTWNVSTELTNAAYANLTNKGVMTLAGEATNNGTLTNNKDINVQGAMTNNSVVTIAADAKIHVNSQNVASLLNNGAITNNGMLYTKVGYDNTITNLGTIDSKAGSTTYITKNSKADESTTATNASAQIMGTLKIAERNLDITVTEENYQGYIEYTPVAADIVSGVFTAIESGDDTQDKYNKVIFSSAVKLNNAGRVKYIVTSKNLNLVKASVNEVTFTGNATLYTQGATIASLTIEDDVLVKVPTINEVYVKTIKSPSLTNVAIHNEGELLVGGDLYTTILSEEYTTGDGEFSAGDGNASAFHWNMDKATGKYQAEGETAFVINQEGLNEALTAGSFTTVVLNAGEYKMPNLTKAVTIECEEGTVFNGNSKLNIAGSTIIGATFSNPGGSAVDQTINGTFKNCTFTGSNGLRWCYAGETVVFENCTFDGSLYGIHFDGGANDVLFKDCTFSGFNAMAGTVTLLTFDGCTFKGNGRSGYNGINLWGSTNLIDCEFTFDGSTGTEWVDCIGADKTYTFQNCTVNGVDYTSANYKEFEKIFSRNNVKVTIDGEECEL